MTTFFSIAEALPVYFDRYPDELRRFAWVQSAMSTGEQLFDRQSYPHHWTASAWIMAPARQEVLVLFHRKLQKWIQPGGHADRNSNLAHVALREAREETGMASLRLSSAAIFDFDVTPIPAFGDIPAHCHLDARFLIWADRDEAIHESNESAGVRWVPLTEVDALCTDAGIARMAAKAARLGSGYP